MPNRTVAMLMMALAPVIQAPCADTLRDALARDFVIGAAIPAPDALGEAERVLLRRQFHAVTPENCMKPAPLQPAEGQWTFTQADALVAHAAAAKLQVNGHVLVWHEQCPEWFFRDGTGKAGRDLILQRMRTHISTVARRYAGHLASWDVVNEAVGSGTDWLRPTPWLAGIGPDYIAEAFIAARAADPTAALYYNDYSIEQPDRREKTLLLIRRLKAAKAPLDGIGIQGHWSLDHVPYEHIENAILAFHAEGLRVAITELDIDVVPRTAAGADVARREQASADPYADGLPDAVQQRLAAQYARLFKLLRTHRDKLSRVTFWGLHDGRSWLNSWPRVRTNHPLLWDRSLQPKPALLAILGLSDPEHTVGTDP